MMAVKQQHKVIIHYGPLFNSSPILYTDVSLIGIEVA